MSFISSIDRNNLPAPKEVLKSTEKYTKKANICVMAFNNAMSILESVYNMASSIKFPEKVMVISKSLGLVSIPLIPFEIARYGATVSKVLEAEDCEAFIRSSIDSVGQGMLLLHSLLSPFKILKALKVFTNIPVIPFLSYLSVPCGIALCVGKVWNLVDTARFARAVYAGSAAIANDVDDYDVAYAQLEALKKCDIKKIEKQFDISKECKLAERVDALRVKLQNNEEGSIKEVAEFYNKMKQRSVEALCFNTFGMLSNISLTAVSSALLFTPLSPTAGAIMMGATGIGSFASWAVKELFTRDNIFDPEAESVFETLMRKAKEAAIQVSNYCMPAVAVAA